MTATTHTTVDISVRTDYVIDGILKQPFIPAPWQQSAACTNADPSLFFIDMRESSEPAKAICARCPVKTECLDYALETSARFGIWGGMTCKERFAEKRRRKQEAA